MSVLDLSNLDRKELRQAIASAYPSPNDLEIFASEELGQNLAVIAGGQNLNTTIFELIKWSIARGYIDDLVIALARDTQNPAIQKFCGRVLKQKISLNDAFDPGMTHAFNQEQSIWDLNSDSEELELFLPRQFTFEADVGKLLQGLEQVNSVCKITFANRLPEESGTGVLIAPGLVLTNYHVLSFEQGAELNQIAKSARFEFGYISTKFGEAPRTQVVSAVEENPVVCFSPIDEYDYALLCFHPADDFTIQPVEFDTSTQLEPRSPLNILQHPEGEEMKISLSNNGVVKTHEEKGLVLYVNATKQCSSGSPCFNQDWKLVALHHKHMATTFGSVREGILFSAIYGQIKSML